MNKFNHISGLLVLVFSITTTIGFSQRNSSVDSTTIITESEFQLVQIVAQDDLNPCVNALLAWNDKTFFKKQSLLEDIQSVLRAKNLAIGHGTFALNWALASHTLETLYTKPKPMNILGELKDGDLKETQIRAYEVFNYIERGEWQCSPQQIELMLRHPERDIVKVL